ncbi:MAG: Rpn family recombination-promoting nuclease/putative transposase [Bacteroidales bacterium]|jgi:predicted transposase/invertase (TIGR01784 family)|nr:Rpn family recombination-promoting nuclease/putative transposase [Bacteroidales bacterium]
MEEDKKGERVLISFDYAIKLLLRDKAHFDILEGFLSELLMREVSLKSIGESESNREYPKDKQNRVDILVEDVSGEIMLIELQFETELDYLHRMLFGTSKAVTGRMVQGMKYKEVSKIYSINIVYFDLGQGSDYVYHGKTSFTGMHNRDELRLSEVQRQTFGKEMAGDIYPEYYILKVNNFDDITKDTLDEWIYMLKNNAVKDEFKARGLQKAREVLDRNNLTPEERKAYDYAMEMRSKDLSDVSSARDEGIAKGRKEGLEEGRIEREEFKKELEKKRAELEKEREKFEKEHEKFEKERAGLLAEITRLKQNGQ